MYSESEARRLVIEAGHKLVKEKLIARTWGNISARISETQFIITPSGKGYEDLGEDELVKVNISDLSYEGELKPSSEKGIHASCYALRPECNFVVHTHQFYASAICAQCENTAFAPCAKYGLSGTKQLARNVAESISSNPSDKSFLMARHGAICLGNDYYDAFNLALELESKCKALFESKKHAPFKGAFLDDYAQMFDSKGRPNEGESPEAIKMVSDKNSAAASYISTPRTVPFLIALIEHTVYTKKYSKLKDNKE